MTSQNKILFFNIVNNDYTQMITKSYEIWKMEQGMDTSNKINYSKNVPLEAQYQEVFPEIGHWVHAEALRDYQEA